MQQDTRTHTAGARRAGRSRHRGAGLATVMAAALAATGCGMLDTGSLTERAIEEAVERASDGSIDIDSESGQFTIDDGEGGTATFGATSEIPDGFDDVVALPGGFQVMAVTEVETDGQRGVNVVGMVEAGSMTDLVDDVDAMLSSAGWSVPDEMADVGDGIFGQVEEMTSRMLQRGDDALMVTIISDETATGPHQLTYLWMPDAQS